MQVMRVALEQVEQEVELVGVVFQLVLTDLVSGFFHSLLHLECLVL